MALENPKIATLKPEKLVDSRFVRKLDENGFIDWLYSTYPQSIVPHVLLLWFFRVYNIHRREFAEYSF